MDTDTVIQDLNIDLLHLCRSFISVASSSGTTKIKEFEDKLEKY